VNRRHALAGLIASGAALAATGASAQDDTAANLETVRRFFADFRAGRDPEQLRGIVADDYVSQDPTAAPGIDAYIARSAEYFRNIDYSYTEYTWTEDALIGSGSTVVWRGREGGTTTDGKLTDVRYLYWFDLNDDHLITTFWTGVDPAEAFLFP